MKRPRWINGNLKIAALLIAVLLEVYFYSPDNSLRAPLSAVLEVTNVPEDMVMVLPENSEHGIPIRVDVRGPRPVVEQIRGSLFRLSVLYPPERPLLFRPAIDLSQLSLPSGVEVLGISPGDLRLEYEPVITKAIPVVVEETGKPKSGFVLNALKPNPPSVRVRGPERYLKDVNEVKAEDVDVTDTADTFECDRRLIASNPLLHYSDDTVKIEAEVLPIAGLANFERVNVKLLAPHGFAGTVEPSRVKVVLAGPAEKLSAISTGRLELEADARFLNEGKHTVKLRGKLPQGVSLVSTDPPLVSVQLTHESP